MSKGRYGSCCHIRCLLSSCRNAKIFTPQGHCDFTVSRLVIGLSRWTWNLSQHVLFSTKSLGHHFAVEGIFEHIRAVKPRLPS